LDLRFLLVAAADAELLADRLRETEQTHSASPSSKPAPWRFLRIRERKWEVPIQSEVTFPRSFLTPERPAFSLRRRSTAPLEGFVFLRGLGGGSAALARRATSRARASA